MEAHDQGRRQGQSSQDAQAAATSQLAAAAAAGPPPHESDFPNKDEWHGEQERWIAKQPTGVAEELPERSDKARRKTWQRITKQHASTMKEVAATAAAADAARAATPPRLQASLPCFCPSAYSRATDRTATAAARSSLPRPAAIEARACALAGAPSPE